MRLCRSLIGAVAVATLLAFASPASAQRHGHPGNGWHGHPGWGWHGHPGWGWHGHPGWGWHGYPGWGGPRVAFAVGGPLWGWGYPYGYGYYPYAYAPVYAYRAPQIYEGRVVTRQPVDAKDASSRGK